MALYQGFCIAKNRKLYPLEIETDATRVISFINEGYKPYESVINSCRLLLAQIDSVVMHHNFRQGNKVAYTLAKHTGVLPVFNKIKLWLFPPPFVLSRMLADTGDFSFVKTISLKYYRNLDTLGN